MSTNWQTILWLTAFCLLHIWVWIESATTQNSNEFFVSAAAATTPSESTPTTLTSDSPTTLNPLTPKDGSILFLSLSLRGHLVPLTRLASELIDRGLRVTFAINEEGRQYANKTSAKIISLDSINAKNMKKSTQSIAKTERREKLKQICHDNSFFRGFLSLVNEIYLPNAAPMYTELHKIVARERPQLIIMDVACIACLDIAHQFGIPYILNNPSLPLRLEHEPHYLSAFHTQTSSPSTASSTSASRASFTPPTSSSSMSWFERSVNFLYPRLLAVALTPSLTDINRFRSSHHLPLFHSPAHIFEAIPTELDTSFNWTEYSLQEETERARREHSALLNDRSSLSNDGSTFLSLSSLIESPSHATCRSAYRGPEVTFINTAFGFEHAYPLPQGVILTGPLMPPSLSNNYNLTDTHGHEDDDHDHDDEDEDESSSLISSLPAYRPSPLSPALAPNLLSWLEKNTKPVILVLFGSGTMSYLTSWQVKALADGLKDSRFRVLWALRTEGKTLIGDNLPNAFRIKNNFPQLGVIAHKQVRLVISPCGSSTVHESLYYGKPLLCIPLFGDQIELSSRVVESGVGLSLEKWHLEPSDISKQVINLVNKNIYRNQAKKMGKILRASGGTKLAADIVQRILRQQKYQLLQQPEQLQCWHQVYQLDLIALFIAFLILSILTIRCICILILTGWTSLRTKSNSGDSEEEKVTWRQINSLPMAIKFAQQFFQPTNHPTNSESTTSSSTSTGTSNGLTGAALNGHSRPSFPPFLSNGTSPPSSLSNSSSDLTGGNGRFRSDSVDSTSSTGSNGSTASNSPMDTQLRQRLQQQQ